MGKFYARTGDAEWQELAAHLAKVSKLAEEFADEFEERAWGKLLGLLHDIGKYTPEFQKRLHNPLLRVDHSTAGAKELINQITARAESSPMKIVYRKYLMRLAAGILAGHHGGLPALAGEFDKRCRSYSLDYSRWAAEITLPPGLPPFTQPSRDRNILFYFFAFRARMLFSCLVDADRLNAETHSAPHKAAARAEYASIAELHDIFAAFINGKTRPDAQPGSVNALRNQGLCDALRAAMEAPGLFRLTLPTGGGKTFSSLAFALAHALRHGKRRIIYVVPYTSIIEQTAEVFRAALGEQYAASVVEHHSNYTPPEQDAVDPKNADDAVPPAWENWDAPLIVTTSVQFFESLHAANASAARKIHNIANSVVVLDEAQNLPTKLLRPCVKAIGELAGHYRTTVVLCTATQPALDNSAWLPEGFPQDAIREICSDVPAFFSRLKRVAVSMPGALDNVDAARRLLSHKKALCIVNTRSHARDLFAELKRQHAAASGMEEVEIWHLSACMHPRHRRAVIHRIRDALAAPGDGGCIVVSTQLVEAGVDLDFPVVYRAIAGLDSIAQAAGRCNREGKLDVGHVYVFENDQYRPVDTTAACLTRDFFARPGNADRDPLDPETITGYFRERYSALTQNELDKENILARIVQSVPEVDFPWVQRKFRFIEDEGFPVIVPVEIDAGGRAAVPAGKAEIDDLVAALRERLAGGIVPRALLRRLQAYTVSLHDREFAALKRAGAVECLGRDGDSFPLLVNRDLYSPETGIVTGDPTAMRPESLVV